MFPREKSLRLIDVEEMMSWFDLVIDKDIVTYPSKSFKYPDTCDEYSNTVLAYIIPPINLSMPPVKILVPDNDYILSVEDLKRTLSNLVKGKEAKIFVLSKYARPGYLSSFINSISAKRIELFIASEMRTIRKYKLDINNTVRIVGTKSHRKLLLVITYGVNREPTLMGYWGSMNVFYPGVDDYLTAVNDWSDMKKLLHGIFRAFFLY